MNRVIRVLMLVLGALGLFSAGLVGTLGLRGQLTKEYLGPLVGAAPAAPDAEHGAAGAEHGGGRATAALPKGAEQPRASAERAGTGDDLLPALQMPSPFSSDETQALFAELESARAELRERTAARDRELKDLELVRVDLNRRWDELNAREESLEEEAKGLLAERSEIDGRSVVLKEAELQNLKQLATDVEKMPADAAAKLLQEKEPDRVAMLLSFVKPRESGRILAAMPPEFAAKVTERMLGILKPEAGAVPAAGSNKDG